jgi:DNA-binding PadR family transcriptional regulator
MSKRLTEPQQELLTEIRESSTGGLYVDRYMRYYRTARALERRGLVTRKWVDSRNDFFAPAEKVGGESHG